MCDTPEYKAFISCQADVFESITHSAASITPLAHHLRSNDLLTDAVFTVVTNEGNTANSRVTDIFQTLSTHIKRDTGNFYSFLKHLEAVGFKKEAGMLKGKRVVLKPCFLYCFILQTEKAEKLKKEQGDEKLKKEQGESLIF